MAGPNCNGPKVMQPYSELANWDGSLSASVTASTSASTSASASSPSSPHPTDPHSTVNLFGDMSVMVNPLSSPSPPDSALLDKRSPPLSSTDRDHNHGHAPSIYEPYHKFLPQASQKQVHRPMLPHTSTSSAFGPSDPLFPPNGHESVLSPQEREIMEDITLDPDDPAAWPSAENDASLLNLDARVGRSIQSRSPSITVGSQLQLQQCPVPNPLVAASASASSISPSPFAPPAVITMPHSKSTPPTSHLDDAAPKTEPAHSDMLAITASVDERAAIEYVIDPTPNSCDKGKAKRVDSPRDGDADMLVVDPSHNSASSKQSPTPPLGASNRSSSSKSRISKRRLSKTPLFLPSPSESLPPDHADGEPDHSTVISISSSSSFSSSSSPRLSHPRRRERYMKKKGQLMAYVLVPPLPPGMRKSDYRHLHLGQLPRTGKERSSAKGKARVGDNSGPRELVDVLRGAFENNSSVVRSAKTPRKRGRPPKKKLVKPVDVVEVLDDEDERGGREGRSKGSTKLAVALANAFAHNSADPKVSALRRLRRSGPIETFSDSASVEMVPPSTKRTRASASADGDNLPTSTPRRKGKRQPRMSTGPPKKRQRMMPRGDDSDDHADEEVEILVNASQELRRVARSMPHVEHHTPQAKSRRITQLRRTSAPSPTPISIPTTPSSPSVPPSIPATPQGVNTLAGLPFTILPAPISEGIVIPSRALSHLQVSPGPPDPGVEAKEGGGEGIGDAQMREYGSQEGFCDEEAAEGAHGLLAIPTAAAATAITTTAMTTDSSPRAPITDPQLTIFDLADLVVPMDVDDRGQEQVQQQPAADHVPDITPAVPPHALRIPPTDHPDGPMFGFVPSDHDDAGRVRPGADTSPSFLRVGVKPSTNMVPDLNFMLATLNSNPDASAGWVDWNTEDLLGTATSTRVVFAGESAGGGTIDPSVLGGGAGSPGKLLRSDSDQSVGQSGPLRSSEHISQSRAIGEEDDLDDLGDEEDVMSLLFQERSRSASQAGSAGKSKSKAVDSTEHASTSGRRKRKKSWRMALAENYEAVTAEDGDDKDEDIEGTQPVSSSLLSAGSSGSSLCHHCRRKTRRPKMRCTLILKSTGKRCRKLYCDLCMEKRYPDLTFDMSATVFACPSCSKFCNCTQCTRARGEEYIPERNGGWRKWGSWPAPAAAMTGPSATPSLSPSLPQRQRRRARQNVVDAPKAAGKGKRDGAGVASVSTAEAFKGVPLSELENWRTPVFTVTGELLGEAFFEGNTPRVAPARSVAPLSPLTPVSQMTLAPACSPLSTIATTFSPRAPDATSSLPVVPQIRRRQHVFIGKPRKSWGRLVSAPNLEEQQKKTRTRRGARRGRGKRKRISIRMYIGSEKPLLFRRVKSRCRHRSASLKPSEGDGNEDADPDVDQDADEGVWPEEYDVADGSLDLKSDLSFTPEEVVRAIGAAFAVGAQ